jgi:hypothetical protein
LSRHQRHPSGLLSRWAARSARRSRVRSVSFRRRAHCMLSDKRPYVQLTIGLSL